MIFETLLQQKEPVPEQVPPDPPGTDKKAMASRFFEEAMASVHVWDESTIRTAEEIKSR